MAGKRIKGLSPNAQAGAHHNPDLIEGINAPAHYALGPTQTDVTYIPSISFGVSLDAGGSSEQAFSVQNPFYDDCIIESLKLNVTAAGGSSCALNIGIVSSSSQSDSDILSSGSVASARIYPIVSGGADKLWKSRSSTANAWLTGKYVRDGSTGLVGEAIITVLPLYSST